MHKKIKLTLIPLLALTALSPVCAQQTQAAPPGTTVPATDAQSWNLSRDVMNSMLPALNTSPTNPFGEGNVWTAMFDSGVAPA